MFTDLTHTHGAPEDHAPHVDCPKFDFSLVGLSGKTRRHYNTSRVLVGEIMIAFSRRAPNHLNLVRYKSVACKMNDMSRAKPSISLSKIAPCNTASSKPGFLR